MAENILDVIAGLQSNGMNDAQILAQLKNLGYTGQEISDAINQAKAKAAVGGGSSATGRQEKEMQPSIMQTGAPMAQAAEEPPVPSPSAKKARKTEVVGTPKTRGYISDASVAETPATYPYAYPAQDTQETYGYADMPTAAASTGTGSAGDIETIEEVAEEIVAEKFSALREKIEDVLNFKEIIETKITNLNDRLKRIESSIDKLQAAVLGRVQEYSRDMKNLGSDMQALEGAFGKILNPLVDNVKELGRITENMKKGKIKGR